MINLNELKVGDYVMVEFEGGMRRGEVRRLNKDEKQVCVETEVQDFWYEPIHLFPLPLNDEQLLLLNFTKDEMANGTVKYKKGSFRLVIPAKDNFSTVEIWYREDKRHNPNIHYIHELQNQHLDMTKVHLTDEAVVPYNAGADI